MAQGPSVVDRLDGVNEGLGTKSPCRVATTTNITRSGLIAIDGITVSDNASTTGIPDRVLVKNQTNAVENGIYDCSTGAWRRSLDFDGNRDVVKGSRVWVNQGTTNSASEWCVTSSNPIVIDTS